MEKITNDINRLYYLLDILDLDNPSGNTRLTDVMRRELNNIEKQLKPYYNYPSLQTESLTPYIKYKYLEVVRLVQSIAQSLQGTTINTDTLTQTTHCLLTNINKMENDYKVIKSGERYIVVSYNGEVLDDAQGCGFKTPQAAYKCMAYKSKSMKELTDNKLRKHIAKKWFDKNKELREDIVDYLYQYYVNYGEEPTDKMVAEIFQDRLTTAPMKAEWMVKYIN